MMDPIQLNELIRPLLLKDLRVHCRARGLSPAGSLEALRDRLKEHMIATNDYSLRVDAAGTEGAVPPSPMQNMDRPAAGKPPVIQQGVHFGDEPALPRALAAQSTGSVYTGGISAPYDSSYNTPASTPKVAAPVDNGQSKGMSAIDLDNIVKPLLLKDLRVQLRARGLSPAGGLEALRDRLKQHMIETNDYTLKNEDGSSIPVLAGAAGAGTVDTRLANNYARPGGQNLDNFLSDRPSSKVLAPPGGGSQVFFGDDSSSVVPKAPAAAPQPEYAGLQQSLGAGSPDRGDGRAYNNYSRPNGQQNLGNFLTDRPSSRVLAPPGGRSQISFG